MLYNNPLIYINANIDIKNDLVTIEQINSYKYSIYDFIQEIDNVKNKFTSEDNIEIFCVLGSQEHIKNIQEKMVSSINKIFDKIIKEIDLTIVDSLRETIENVEKSITDRFIDLYISTIFENGKLRYPRMTEIKISNGISCLGLYLTNSAQEEKEFEVNSAIQTFLEKEKPFFMGNQIMIQSFLFQDVRGRKILSVLPDVEGEWYALLEGGIKLYLNNEKPYQREKMSSPDWSFSQLDSALNNPCCAYGKNYVPSELFEEWNKVFLYALATLQIKYDEKTLELLYNDFLEFIEKDICDVQEANETIVSKRMFIKTVKLNIEITRGYLKGNDELGGVSKNILILLKNRYSYLPTIYKIIEKYYPKQVQKRISYTKLCATKWKKLLDNTNKQQTNYEKGISLEEVADYFVSCIEGIKVTERRAKTKNEEMDIVCCNISNNSELWKMGPVILIECKNWKNKIDTKVIRNLTYIMDKKGVSGLLLFVKKGITNGAKSEIVKQIIHNKYILTFNLQELYKIDNKKIKPTDLIILKIKELEKEAGDKIEELV